MHQIFGEDELRVLERPSGELEGDAMLRDVFARLLIVPLEVHLSSVSGGARLSTS